MLMDMLLCVVVTLLAAHEDLQQTESGLILHLKRHRQIRDQRLNLESDGMRFIMLPGCGTKNKITQFHIISVFSQAVGSGLYLCVQLTEDLSED